MGYLTGLASVRLPTSLDNLRAERIAIDDLEVRYRISCPGGGVQGTVASQRDATGGFWVDPYVFACAECGRAATFFDSSRDGYDGVLNGGGAYEQRTRNELVTCPECNATLHNITGCYAYSFPEDEIQDEWTEEERARFPDLFSSVYFDLECGACGNQHELGEFECA